MKNCEQKDRRFRERRFCGKWVAKAWALFLLEHAMLTSFAASQEERPAAPEVAIPLAKALASNVPDLAAMINGEVLEFRRTEPAPPGAEYYFIRYAFELPAEGRWRVRIETDRSPRGRSSLSCALDEQPACQLVHRRMVGEAHGWRESPEAIPLKAGQHTLELRFYPQQRVRKMNRISEDYEGHWVAIRRLGMVREEPLAGGGDPIGGLQLRAGDRVVFFGDSITDEELY
ncbi:MAG: hypothetical protein N3A66_10970, partial [Planctomycetota bacterium]|nr:hypothetical protein [Planctomycetota bacterium]